MIRISDILKKAKEREKEKEKEKSLAESPPPVTQSAEPVLPTSPQQAAPPPSSIAAKKRKPKKGAKKSLAESPPPKTAAREPVLPPPPQATAPSSSTMFTEKMRPKEEVKKEALSSSEINISSIMTKESKTASKEECDKIYDEVLFLTRDIMSEDANYELIDVDRIAVLIDKVVIQVQLNNTAMIELALTRDCLEKYPIYLYCHVVNVCILALLLGVDLGYTKSKLMDLGIAALLHDVGMIECIPLISQPRKLDAKEFNLVKRHTDSYSKVLDKIKGLNEIPAIVAGQHHERLDGSGYPRGLKGDDIHEYAKIVGLADTYEAMMHSRDYRREFPALETMREIIAHKGAYEYKYVKKLMNKVGIFSIGQLVVLNTKEVALVVKLNPHNILRPIVEIVYDTTGEKINERKKIDLASEPNIWIIKGTKDAFRE